MDDSDEQQASHRDGMANGVHDPSHDEISVRPGRRYLWGTDDGHLCVHVRTIDVNDLQQILLIQIHVVKTLSR